MVKVRLNTPTHLVDFKFGKTNAVVIALGSAPEPQLAEVLKSKLAKHTSGSLELKVSQNNHLIAGYRIRLVDDVFEDSIQSRLRKLSQSLIC